jgi:two-component system, chemotaxis family, response regulator Rcp1
VNDPSNRKAVEVLLVEDNPGDARLTVELLRDSGIPTKINHVRDGVQALAFLRREGAFREMPQTELILLDLNLPRIDGRDLLGQIKRDPKLKTIPLVVLTGSQNDGYLVKPLVAADCFMTKPVDPEKFVMLIQAMDAHNTEAEEGTAAASKIKSRLISDLTEEIHTRLNSIVSFADLMQRQTKGTLIPEYRDYAHSIHKSAVGLERLIADILDLSKTEAVAG